MATIRAYTTIGQSRKLAEILPLESADMCYEVGEDLDGYITKTIYTPLMHISYNDDYIPYWSLAALLGVLEHPRCFQGDKPTYWFCGCFGKDKLYHEVEADNPVDACVKMIIKLNELNLL